MKNAYYILTIVCCVLFASCSMTQQITRGEQYAKMYEEKPITFLVMPPINNSTNVEAKDLLYTSISYPLIESGYYVLSPMLTMEILKKESAYDAEMFIEGDLSQFRNVLGADAAMFTIIKSWKRNNIVKPLL